MIALERPALIPQGNVRYALKTPYRDGTTHVIFEPLDFLARLAALVPSPRVNLTRFHGVFAPNAALRSKIVPALRGRGKHARPAGEGASAPCRGSLSWAQRLKRVFAIDIETCERCGGAVKIIACVRDPRFDGISNLRASLVRRSSQARANVATRRPALWKYRQSLAVLDDRARVTQRDLRRGIAAQYSDRALPAAPRLRA